MKWLKTVLPLALVAFWLPATLHCQLEELPGLQFLACCDHETKSPHQDDDCRTDSCAMVEDGLYKTNESTGSVVSSAVQLMEGFAFAPSTATQSAGRHILRATDIPAELPATWQFSQRTALPPRAPSLVS